MGIPRFRWSGKSDYTAHLGANSGGANGVYWVEVLDAAEGGVLVRNIAARGKHAIDTVEHVIEPDLLYPLLRWSDVRRYSATPRGSHPVDPGPGHADRHRRGRDAASDILARWPIWSGSAIC